MASPPNPIDEEDIDKGSMWVLDQPMEEEAGRLRNMYREKLFASRAESMLKLHQLVKADSTFSNIPKFESYLPYWKFFGMAGDSYLFFVRTQVEMALGRFENAVSASEKAGQIDPRDMEISAVLHKVRSVARARTGGNDLFNSGKFSEAWLMEKAFNSTLPILFYTVIELGQWERSIDDCNQALRIEPNYAKALLRRAAPYGKLEHWAKSVRDYEALRKEIPGDSEVAEALFHA